MVSKEKLKEQQPVAWKILSGALLSNRLSHAYLFHGPKTPAKKQMALLFAQSMVCTHPDEDGFACQRCEDCLRMEREETPDFFWLHEGGFRTGKPLSRKEIEQWWKERKTKETSPKTPSKQYRIRKDDILALQDTFAASASTDKRQIYILEDYDQATVQASNALLKFLEEPREGITGILSAGDLSSVLTTIISRCQLIPFRPQSYAALEEELRTIIDDENIVSVLAGAGMDADQALTLLEEEAVFELRDAAREYWKAKDSHMAIVSLQNGVFSRTKKPSRRAVEFFLYCLLGQLRNEPVSRKGLALRQVVLEHLDALRLPVDPVLLMDRCCSEILKICRRKD